VARLTPEGQVFYEEAIKTLAQAERSIATAQRAAKGEIGRLGVGFIGFASCSFLPGLLRTYKARHPGVALRLEENVPDTIVRACNDNGFSPRLHNELNNMHSVLSTVEAEEGVAIVTASARNLRADNVSFFRLQPDIVDAVVYLTEARHVTGEVLHVDGGAHSGKW
jgi:DNA-binding transcriptional LysR family regulator